MKVIVNSKEFRKCLKPYARSFVVWDGKIRFLDEDNNDFALIESIEFTEHGKHEVKLTKKQVKDIRRLLKIIRKQPIPMILTHYGIIFTDIEV